MTAAAPPYVSSFDHLAQEQRMQRALRALTRQHGTAQHIRIRIRKRPCTTTIHHITDG
jgi:hypothetical protein